MDNVQSPVNSGITFRGEWQPDTLYKVGDYVYVKDRRPGFFYKCTVAGKSQSEVKGYSDLVEPGWKFNENVYDNLLVWRSIPISEVKNTSPGSIQNCEPNRVYNINQVVRQQSGNPLILNDVEFVFQLKEILIKHDWPKVPDVRMNDNSVEWQCYLSVGYLLPPARLKEPVFYEFVQIMDYLILHEQLYFNDFIHKYNDLTKVRPASLKEIIAEQGYKYVCELLNLSDKELQALVKYMSIISDLKGTESGLEVVFNMVNIKYSKQQWWEKSPKGTPHTWDLAVEVEIEKVVANMMTNLVTFARNYVYPVIENFEITYKMNMAELVIVLAGFIDIEYNTEIQKSFLTATQAGFIDITSPGLAERHQNMNNIICAGFTDINYNGEVNEERMPLIIRGWGITTKEVVSFVRTSTDYLPKGY